MRKTITIMFIFSITILLIGCNKDNTVELPTTQQLSTPTAVATATRDVTDTPIASSGSMTPTPTTTSQTISSVDQKQTTSVTEGTKNQTYTITTTTYSQDNIKVQYPQIQGLGDNSKEKTINDLIKNDVLKSEVEAPIKFYQDDTHQDVLTLDLKYQVTVSSTDLLSVVYTGYSNIAGAAHPNDVIYSVTIDLKNMTKLKLSDFTTIDTKLAQKIKQSTAVINEAVKDGMDKNDLILVIKNTDDQTLIKGLREQWAYNTFYVTSNSLVVSVDVPHAVGDYALVELQGQYKVGSQ
ncbi:PdaC/SigV domain-containing protein [Paenibacillus planticolens]|uniref:DUF4163 domain-containing protein n=1 Tax=Paenibacillus planticolens TaxID=2654976 RepID=A0ABX1ZY17_9BACL|nr:DUF4163 domain-containing protein [Paenibacillus planticolens]NOV04847.1 DUF4163 domain-containing protein [Paenibacillus planticolens]